MRTTLLFLCRIFHLYKTWVLSKKLWKRKRRALGPPFPRMRRLLVSSATEGEMLQEGKSKETNKNDLAYLNAASPRITTILESASVLSLDGCKAGHHLTDPILCPPSSFFSCNGGYVIRCPAWGAFNKNRKKTLVFSKNVRNHIDVILGCCKGP